MFMAMSSCERRSEVETRRVSKAECEKREGRETNLEEQLASVGNHELDDVLGALAA